MDHRIPASIALALALAACSATPPASSGTEAVAAQPAAAPTRYSAAQFFETTAYGLAGGGASYAFSHDGQSLLIHHDGTGVYNAYALPVDGGPARALTASTTESIFAESWFPHDNRMLYASDAGGNENDHLFVRAEDGTVRDLTPGENVKASFVGFAADGKSFWILSNARNAKVNDLYRVDANTYAQTLVWRNDGAYSFGAISRDGRWMAVEKARTTADGNVWLVDLTGDATPRLITQHSGNQLWGAYGFTADSARLILSTNANGEFAQAVTHDIATGQKSPLIAADWDVTGVADSPTGRYRVHTLNEDAQTRLFLNTADGKPVVLKGLPAGEINNVRYSPDEKRIAFRLSSDTSPANVWVADLATGATRRLTTALSPAIDERHLVEASIARFKSWDGMEVPGVLYRPHEASATNPVPAVVLVHGGPGGQSTRGYSAIVQHIVNHGYAVYAINNRGSSGYGKTFFNADNRRHGDVDLKDIVASKAFLQGMDWIADDRIAIAGGSYGGYLTAAALTFYPTEFDAGINIFGVTNWTRTLNSIPPYWESFREALFDEMGDPKTDAERHRAISPLFHAKNIVRPMMVVQGANDPRVLQIESDELVAAARASGAPVEYIVFPDEGHGFLKKANRVRASDAYVAFLDKYVKNKPR